ncbi:hypothetical protein CEXT_198371 [Caerostris extrusa]|uniref:Uncharacterized protein n=1 Tax=Caerostris extrusa TaxID=172846 RepID=A0AAV4R5Q3_CAEEX|nr:hypothetical protein CEXT_198371 [Caerostris extrusa]
MNRAISIYLNTHQTGKPPRSSNLTTSPKPILSVLTIAERDIQNSLYSSPVTALSGDTLNAVQSCTIVSDAQPRCPAQLAQPRLMASVSD